MTTESKQSVHAPATPMANGGSAFVTRELNGATFLTLEHVAHMVLAVVVPVLLAAGIISALSMWTGSAGITMMMFSSISVLGLTASKIVEAGIALGVVAALAVLAAGLFVFDRRTRAEWHKRPSYAARLAYKMPVYSALAVLAAMLVAAVIEMLYVVITSLAYLGIPNAPIGSLYLDNFLSAAITFVMLGVAAWYVFNLAKGRDYGKKFVMGAVALSVVVGATLLITSVVVLHNDNSGFSTSPTTDSSSMTNPGYNSKSYQDLLNQLSQ